MLARALPLALSGISVPLQGAAGFGSMGIPYLLVIKNVLGMQVIEILQLSVHSSATTLLSCMIPDTSCDHLI